MLVDRTWRFVGRIEAWIYFARAVFRTVVPMTGGLRAFIVMEESQPPQHEIGIVAFEEYELYIPLRYLLLLTANSWEIALDPSIYLYL